MDITHLTLFLPLGILSSFLQSAPKFLAMQLEQGCRVSHLSFFALHREHEGVSFLRSGLSKGMGDRGELCLSRFDEDAARAGGPMAVGRMYEGLFVGCSRPPGEEDACRGMEASGYEEGNGIYGAKQRQRQTKAKVEFDRRRRVVWGPEQSEARTWEQRCVLELMSEVHHAGVRGGGNRYR